MNMLTPYRQVRRQRRNCAREGGFSLVEVLVALLVLSIGLLGLAGLQAGSVRANHGAYLRSQATALGYDMLDRMRANRTSALNGNYDVAMSASAPTSTTTLADKDKAGWLDSLDTTLPGGDGSVATNGKRVTITVQWSDAMDNGNTASFQVEAEI